MAVALGLGTAQFGLDYGVTNQHGQIRDEDAAAILSLAANSGVRVVDTAHAYGNAEAVVGRSMPRPCPFDLVTKSPVFDGCPIDDEAVERMQTAFDNSLHLLRLPKVHGYLVHHAKDLLAPGADRLFARMVQWRDSGLCDRIGVSAYSGDDVLSLLDRFPIDLVQLPLNVFDQRLVADRILDILKHHGIEVHVRSVFLQGTLLTDPDTLPIHLQSYRSHFARYRRDIDAAGLSPSGAALAFVRGVAGVDHAIVGVSSVSEFRDIAKEFQTGGNIDYRPYATTDIQLIDPTLWPAAVRADDGTKHGEKPA